MTDAAPVARARVILDGQADPGSWQELEDLAHEVALSDRSTAADLLILASEVARSEGQGLQAVGLARAAIYLASRFHPTLAARAADAATAALQGLTSSEEYFHQAGQLAQAFTATGLTTEGVSLGRSVLAQAEGLPASTSASVAHAQALSSLAAAQIRADQFLSALETLAEAKRRVPDDAHKVTGDIEYNEGLARASLDQVGLARAAYARSRQAFELGGDEIDLAYLDRLDAAALARTGRYREARDLYERALATFRRRELSLEIDQTAVGLVQALSQLGTRWTNEELDRYEQLALTLPPSEALALGVNVANIAHQQHDAERADRLYQRFAQMARDLNRPVDLARCESSYAVALRERGDLKGAWRANRSAAAAFDEAGLLRQLANTHNNASLLLEDIAQVTADEQKKGELRGQAADYAVRSIVSLDAFRHSLPEAADRRALQTQTYPYIFLVAVRACIRAERWDVVAAVVEKSRIQPVLAGRGQGFMEPAPLAARPGSSPIGGSGPPVVLTDLAAGPASDTLASWHGWWNDKSRLVRCRSRSDRVEAEVGDLDRESLELFAAALPIVLPQDVAAVGGDASMAQLLALWRATSGPLLNDPDSAEILESLLPASVRARIAADPAVAGCRSVSGDELLWPLSKMLFTDAWIEDLFAARASGLHRRLVVAPPPLLGRIPWAALPLSDPSEGTPLQLIEAADVIVGLPATLAAGLRRRSVPAVEGRNPGLVVADPLGDLRFARRLRPPGMKVLGSAGFAPATRATLLSELREGVGLLVVNAHVEPGSEDDPASSALLLRGPGGGIDRMRVAEFQDLNIPSECIVLGCDGAGAATGTEWTGLVTGLIWAGATEVVTTTVPVIDDSVTAELDAALVEEVCLRGATTGLLSWQRDMAGRRREKPSDPHYAPYRWAQTVAIRTAGSEADPA